LYSDTKNSCVIQSEFEENVNFLVKLDLHVERDWF